MAPPLLPSKKGNIKATENYQLLGGSSLFRVVLMAVLVVKVPPSLFLLQTDQLRALAKYSGWVLGTRFAPKGLIHSLDMSMQLPYWQLCESLMTELCYLRLLFFKCSPKGVRLTDRQTDRHLLFTHRQV